MFGLPHYWLTGLCTSAIARSSDYVEYRYGTYWTVSRLECTSVESTVRNNGCSQCFSAAGPCCLPLPRTWQTARSSALRDSGRLVVTMGSSREISCIPSTAGSRKSYDPFPALGTALGCSSNDIDVSEDRHLVASSRP